MNIILTGAAHHPFLDSVRARADVDIVEATVANKESLPGRVLSMTGRAPKGRGVEHG